ncbi:isochorismatase family protein [Luteibacter yeojuensis]|uniref:Hydrolase n=1 Tax=Luteibacter yeojuensis TaxID=345309 RepID=A0A0F3KY18_9GAMM|nr:isochorismatase family protein [Luteibacter yeojuensis]KJV36103.1 hydrolase [Luteibacter yeojuensis]
MALTQLDANAALIVIDLQQGIISLPVASPAGPVVEKAAAIARAFRQSGRHVVLVNVDAGAPGRTDGGVPQVPQDAAFKAFAPELGQAPTDYVVTKKRWGAFQTTDLDAHLRGLNVEQVVILGIATSIGVESTARYASELGYNVVLVTDAMADLKADAHENSIKNIFPRLGETTTAEALLAKIG